MGILTSAYEIDGRLFDAFLEDSNNLDVIIYPDEKKPHDLGLQSDWSPNKHFFDKVWEDLLRLLRGTGFKNIANILEFQGESIEYKYSDIYIRYINSPLVKRLSSEMEKTSGELLSKLCLEKGDITDYDGNVWVNGRLHMFSGGMMILFYLLKK